MKDLRDINASREGVLSGRRAQKFADAQRAKWGKRSDGVNRASIRKEMAQAPRAVRLAARAQMTHQKDLAHLRMHPLGGGNAESTVRNLHKTARRARR